MGLLKRNVASCVVNAAGLADKPVELGHRLVAPQFLLLVALVTRKRHFDKRFRTTRVCSSTNFDASS